MRFAPPVTLLLFLSPVLCGLLAVVLPAFGYFPALGLHAFSLAPFVAFFETPHLLASVLLTLRCGFLATLVSCLVVFALFASFGEGVVMRFLRRSLSPLLSVPHAAVALGVGFLFAPSGWFLRLLSPWLTGFDEPPLWLTNPDPYGILYVLALVVKEVPFLFLMTLSAENADNAPRTLEVAQGLGYARRAAFCHSILPMLYRRVRLSVYAVLAFSLTNLEVALTLAPSRPGLFAERLLALANAPDLLEQPTAAAAALFQVIMVATAIIVWRGGEKLIETAWRARLQGRKIQGHKNQGRKTQVWKTKLISRFNDLLAGSSGLLVWLLGLLAITLLPLWSFAETKAWRFPAALPDAWTLDLWHDKFERFAEPLWLSLSLAIAAAGFALLLCVLCLEQESRRKTRLEKKIQNKPLDQVRARGKVRVGNSVQTRAMVALYLPLLLPHTSFLFGIQILLFSLSVRASWLILVWSHMLFVLPYVFLSLSGSMRGLDRRFSLTAESLGCSPARRLVRVTLPLLLKPLLTAFALGVAVSIALYAPTVLIGAGRYATLTSEAVALSSGGDRRIVGAFALLQAALPFFFFGAALLVPMLVWRKRVSMRGLYS